MMIENIYNIHGDNIVECERVINIIIEQLNKIASNNIKYNVSLDGFSTIKYDIKFKEQSWLIHLLPGYNKRDKIRRKSNIHQILKNNGSILEEMPDAIITKIEDKTEKIICAIEFCSAIQAGNQAWQRQGRGYSIALAGYPYLYILDLGKYELNKTNRKRKNIRFPNPAIPYSYLNFNNKIESFIAQIYNKSEEFNSKDKKFINFNSEYFIENGLSEYLVKLMLGENTDKIEDDILNKSFKIMLFIASKNSANDFNKSDWIEIEEQKISIIDYIKKYKKFNFKKTISMNNMTSNIQKFINIVSKNSIGICSKSLPFGLVPFENINNFKEEIFKIYPNAKNVLYNLSEDCIICIIKGFKPKGDDSRPDRGILPLIKMLTDDKIKILTYIYGPIHAEQFNYLVDTNEEIFNNGLWRVLILLSDYIFIDTHLIIEREQRPDEKYFCFQTLEFKNKFMNKLNKNHSNNNYDILSPTEYEILFTQEDDVDTFIHFIFAHVLKEICYECMCNPPGGDWSGLSIFLRDKNKIIRWLSLPRETNLHNSTQKRPDHVIQLKEKILDHNILLSIESKEKEADLETNVEVGLKEYIKHLIQYPHSAEKNISDTSWNINNNNKEVKKDDFFIISCAAFISKTKKNINDNIHSSCDILFILIPNNGVWEFQIINTTENPIIMQVTDLLSKNCKDIYNKIEVNNLNK